MFHSLRWRLILSYMLLTLLTVGVVGTVTYHFVTNSLGQMEYENLRANAEAVAHQAYPLMWPRLATGELQQLSQTAAFLGDVHVRILDNSQQVVADSNLSNIAGRVMMVVPFNRMGMIPGMMEDMLAGAVLFQVGPGDFVEFPASFFESLPPGTRVTIVQRGEGLWGGHFTFDEITSGEERNVAWQSAVTQTPRSKVAVVVPVGDLNNPVGYVRMSEPPALSTHLLDRLRQALLIAGAGAALAAGLFGLWNSHRLAAPLKNLARASAQMGSGDLSARAEVKTRGEIGELASQFNQMAASLQSSFDQLAAERDALRHFIADASHELRTPITALKNFNTLLLGPAADDAAARAEFLAESQAQIERLEWMTHNLLDLSRLDAGLHPLDLSEHDLREIVESAVATFSPRATENQINLRVCLPEHACLWACDRARLEMALSNLLDNALKFTPVHGQVTVTLESQPGQILVGVRDTGAGISPEDLPHIFERFYRGKAMEAEGSGLGLAIVKSVVEAHGGQVKVESEQGQGTLVTLQFPMDS